MDDAGAMHFRELLPDEWEKAPFEGKVEHDLEKLLWLTEKHSLSLPIPLLFPSLPHRLQ